MMGLFRFCLLLFTIATRLENETAAGSAAAGKDQLTATRT